MQVPTSFIAGEQPIARFALTKTITIPPMSMWMECGGSSSGIGKLWGWGKLPQSITENHNFQNQNSCIDFNLLLFIASHKEKGRSPPCTRELPKASKPCLGSPKTFWSSGCRLPKMQRLVADVPVQILPPNRCHTFGVACAGGLSKTYSLLWYLWPHVHLSPKFFLIWCGILQDFKVCHTRCICDESGQEVHILVYRPVCRMIT